MEDYIESVETQEIAGPVDTDVSDVTDTGAVEETTEVVEETTNSVHEQVQSAEENARYAAARRKAEERQRLLDERVVRNYGEFEHPITHKKISSAEEYFDALEEQRNIQDRQRLASGTMSADEVDNYLGRLIENNPIVQQAQALLKQNEQAQMDNAINEGVKEIQRFDSSVKSINDILLSDKADQIIGYVRDNNMSLADAYKMANFDKLMAHINAGAKQAAINNMKGTQHLNQTNGVANSSDGGVDIPDSELSIWKKAFPDASLKELKAKYNRTL